MGMEGDYRWDERTNMGTRYHFDGGWIEVPKWADDEWFDKQIENLYHTFKDHPDLEDLLFTLQEQALSREEMT